MSANFWLSLQQGNPPAKVPWSSMEIPSVISLRVNINMETGLFWGFSFVSGYSPPLPELHICPWSLFPWISSFSSALPPVVAQAELCFVPSVSACRGTKLPPGPGKTLSLLPSVKSLCLGQVVWHTAAGSCSTSDSDEAWAFSGEKEEELPEQG